MAGCTGEVRDDRQGRCQGGNSYACASSARESVGAEGRGGRDRPEPDGARAGVTGEGGLAVVLAGRGVADTGTARRIGPPGRVVRQDEHRHDDREQGDEAGDPPVAGAEGAYRFGTHQSEYSARTRSPPQTQTG